jgi:hypothetical protein
MRRPTMILEYMNPLDMGKIWQVAQEVQPNGKLLQIETCGELSESWRQIWVD